MGNKHKVRFEPVDIEIEVDEDETVLDAAFRHGVMLMHGCKEGQCSACKSFLLDGDLEMDRWSTFALNEFEEEEGFVLLCRSYAYSDLEVELLSFREEMLNTGIPLQLVYAEVEEIEALTHDMKRLVLKLVDPPEMNFLPGQYAELYIPESDRGAPGLLDGQHPLQRRACGVHHQGVSGWQVLGPSGRRDSRSGRG